MLLPGYRPHRSVLVLPGVVGVRSEESSHLEPWMQIIIGGIPHFGIVC